MIFSLLIFYPKIVFINFLTQVFIRFSFDTVLFTVFYPTPSKTGVGYWVVSILVFFRVLTFFFKCQGYFNRIYKDTGTEAP